MNIIANKEKTANIKNTFLKKRSGFSGLTHMLIAILLYCLMIKMPVSLLSDFVSFSTSNYIFMISTFVVIIGASLLPDLDNDISTATVQLGIMGALIKTIMQTVSYVIYSITRMQNDEKAPKSMHRKFFHTPFFALCLILMFWFLIKPSSSAVIDLFNFSGMSFNQVWNIINNYTVSIVCLILVFICSWLGVNNLLYWPLKLIKVRFIRRHKQLLYILFALGITVFAATIPMTQLRYMGVAIGIGYIFHLIGDLFTQGSIPIIFPIPAFWKKQWWWSPWILGPLQIYTGGLVNNILNIALGVIDILMLVSLFI